MNAQVGVGFKLHKKEYTNDSDFDEKMGMNIPKSVEDSFSLDYRTKAWWL